MGLLEDRRAREHARRLARTWAAHAGGESGLPTLLTPPRQRGSAQPIILAGQKAQDPGGIAAAAGETITVFSEVSSAGWIEAWDQVIYQTGFAGGTNPPIQSFRGYYNAYVDVVLDAAVSDLEVRGQSAEGRQVVDVSPFASEWRGVLALDDEPAGSPLRVYVDPKGETAQVTVTFHLVEPIGLQALAPVQPGPTLVDSAANGRVSTSGPLSVPVPPSTQEGDLLILSFSGHSHIFGGSNTNITVPAGFTVAYDEKFGGLRVMHWIGWKLASSADAAGTSSYEFAPDSTVNGMHVVSSVVRGPTSLGTVESDAGFANSKTSPRTVTAADPSLLFGFSTFHAASGLISPASNRELVGEVSPQYAGSAGGGRAGGYRLIGSMDGGATAGMGWEASDQESSHAVSVVAVETVGGA